MSNELIREYEAESLPPRPGEPGPVARGIAYDTGLVVTARPTTGGQLSVIAGGRRAPNPAELLSGHTFRELIAEAAATYDRVIIDSAPVLAVSDTLLMRAFAQTVCLVIRAPKTPRNAVQRALFLLGGSGTRPAGLILNRLPRERGRGYYYYDASHGYDEGEGAYGSGTYGSTPRSSDQLLVLSYW